MILAPRKREQVMPLPVALISTISQKGIRNAAPWSNITPILRPFDDIMLASWIKRDTLGNILETGDFVVNVPPASMVNQVMICSKNYPPQVDEFDMADLTPRVSQKVKSPGIEGCLAWAECEFVEEIRRKNYSIVIGKVVHLEADERFFNEAGDMDFERAEPLCVMLGDKGMWFTRPTSTGRYAEYQEMFLNRKDAAIFSKG